ncbi:MAG: peptidylprolyl isomerase [Marinirhabdus sp.]|nr:peptidylprolyl isomerase [Marinirhabdus sp.]
MRNIFFLLFSIVWLTSCDYLKTTDTKVPVARVNSSYLYQEDIEGLISENTSKEDSTLIVSSYINRWATQQLLMDQARINISEMKQQAFNKLVEDYRKDLYTEAYKSTIVLQMLDSTVSQRELQEFYEANKENFKLNDELFKLRYIQVNEGFGNLASTKKRLETFDEDDIEKLETESIQYKAFNFNDSTWVKRAALTEVLPILQNADESLLKKSNFIELQDSLGVYLVKIVDKLNPKDIAPLSHVEPTIRQVILNKRKLELIKKLESDITRDALKNNNFEIYEDE